MTASARSRLEVEPDAEMSDVFLGGYWGARAASADEIAKTLFEWLGQLEKVHDALGSWSAMGQPVTTYDRLVGIVGMCFNPDEETGEPLTDLGFNILGASGSDDLLLAEMSVHAGATASPVPNSVLLESPYDEAFPNEWITRATPILETIVSKWKPEVAVLTRTAYIRALKSIMRGNWRKPGALTWLPVAPDKVPQVVDGQSVTPLADGALISLMEEEAMPEVETVVALAKGLLEAGLLDPKKADESGA